MKLRVDSSLSITNHLIESLQGFLSINSTQTIFIRIGNPTPLVGPPRYDGITEIASVAINFKSLNFIDKKINKIRQDWPSHSAFPGGCMAAGSEYEEAGIDLAEKDFITIG
ncbi:uncharacterized protein MELLADRAFT_92822 [Melampsora larici-populina 98AG31]|uniref:Uncharacterized protein n=1 Tax=Melampsora larici-populina (strain 98AG31 / pathotype 3-4-7) TaxID=747676 RepID=F4S2X3_MELLP|nr:uncharacterized protein MELLADRAFT_92822 [Melampsora larici-populina 98AG31]EGG01004.1 hypothetical protein MELLADRAFT_92822 [Melampsora larici-populina 98AG31]